MPIVVSDSFFRIAHQHGENYVAMSTPQESRERRLENPLIVGHVLVYHSRTGEQRSREDIACTAGALSHERPYFLCTYWEGRTGEASRYWRVIIENA